MSDYQEFDNEMKKWAENARRELNRLENTHGSGNDLTEGALEKAYKEGWNARVPTGNRIISREELRSAIEYGLKYGVTAGNITDTIINELFGDAQDGRICE